MREFTHPATVTDLVGDWYLVATTMGQFDAMPRVEGATMHVVQGENGVHSSVTYRTRRRSWSFSAVVPDRASRRGFYRWFGGAAGIIASRFSWQLAKSSDGSIMAAHNPGSMMVNEGVAFIARSDIPERTAIDTIRREYFRLGLDARDLDTLSWRVGPGRVEAGS